MILYVVSPLAWISNWVATMLYSWAGKILHHLLATLIEDLAQYQARWPIPKKLDGRSLPSCASHIDELINEIDLS
jgi:hypothetical protein